MVKLSDQTTVRPGDVAWLTIQADQVALRPVRMTFPKEQASAFEVLVVISGRFNELINRAPIPGQAFADNDETNFVTFDALRPYYSFSVLVRNTTDKIMPLILDVWCEL